MRKPSRAHHWFPDLVLGVSMLAPFLLTACGGESGAAVGANPTVAPTSNPPNSATNPVAEIYSLNPRCAPVGALTFTLTASARNLVPNSVLRWNGADLPSTVDVLGQQITAQIPASDIATAATATITVFNPNSGGGSSGPMSFPIVTGGTNPMSVAVDPTGRFAYVANQGCLGSLPGSVSMYQIGPTGGLSSLGTISAGSGPDSITIDPLGKFAYVANYDSNDVSTYTISPTTGVLTSSGKTALGTNPLSITVGPSGRFAYLANSLGKDVLMYAIDPNTGALTSMGSSVPEVLSLQTPWDGPNSVTVDPLGRFAYVAIRGDGGDMSDGSVSVYTINPETGILTFEGRAAGSCGASDSLCGPHSVAIDRSGAFAIAVGAYGGASLYSINSVTGILTSLDTVNTGKSSGVVALDRTGQFAYVANFDTNDVSTYAIDVGGETLTPTGSVPAGSNPIAIAIAPSGEFAYVANYGSNDVSIYSINAVTGALTLIASIGT